MGIDNFGLFLVQIKIMAQKVHEKQVIILNFLKQYIQKYGKAPKLREIAEAIGVTSLATVHEHLWKMEERGLIKRKKGNEEIVLLKTDVTLSPEGFEVPILGFIAAGSPIEPYTDPNATISIPPSFGGTNKSVFVLQVKGDSMIEEQIRDGDYVICEHTETARNGEIVVALLENGFVTLKRFYKEATRIKLEPANSNMDPIFVKKVKIQGKVVGLIRKYN